MLDWKEIEKIVFAGCDYDISCKGELLALKSLLELNEQFEQGKVLKEQASTLKAGIKAKYEGLKDMLLFLPELAGMISVFEFNCENSDEFVKLMLNEYGALRYKTNKNALYQKLGIAVFEYYEDRMKEISKKRGSI